MSGQQPAAEGEVSGRNACKASAPCLLSAGSNVSDAHDAVQPAQWERRGERWWPELSACYMLTAQKRVNTLTPVRPVWRKKPKVVAGLAEPSTRVSRIRFD